MSLNMKTSSVKIVVSRKRVVLVVASLAFLNTLMLIGTAVFMYYFHEIWGGDWSKGSNLKHLLVQFHLATENVVASWYSSMLLLIVSAFSILCYLCDQTQERCNRASLWSYGWLFIAVTFFMLSLDEIGSLHENIGAMPALNPFGSDALGWVKMMAVPIGLVAAALVVFGWIQLRRSLPALVLMHCGVLLFLSVPVQEHLEAASMVSSEDWTQAGEWRRPILDLLFEEGAELWGSLCFIAATLTYLSSISRRSGSTTASAPFSLSLSLEPKAVLAAAAVLVCLFGLGLYVVDHAAPYLPKGDHGIPQNWFPSALAFLAAILCFQLSESDTSGAARSLYLATALFNLFLSAYYGADMRNRIPELGLAAENVIGGTLAITAVASAVALAALVQNWWSRAGTLAWGLTLGLGFGAGRSFSGAVGVGVAAFTLLLPSLSVHFLREPRRPSQRNSGRAGGPE